MTKKPKEPEALHQLTVRIPKALNARLEATATATDRTYRDIAEAAISQYLNRLKLTPKQEAVVRSMLAE